MDGHWLWVWVGRDGNNVCILLLCNYSREWLSLCCPILVVSATGLVCLGFLCRYVVVKYIVKHNTIIFVVF